MYTQKTWLIARVITLAVITLGTIFIVWTIQDTWSQARRLEHPHELDPFFVSKSVSHAFKSILRRSPDPAELEAFNIAVGSGHVSIDKLQSVLKTSTEYSHNAVSENAALDKLILSLRTKPVVPTVPIVPDVPVIQPVPVDQVYEPVIETSTGWRSLSARALSERDVGGSESLALDAFPEPSTAV